MVEKRPLLDFVTHLVLVLGVLIVGGPSVRKGSFRVRELLATLASELNWRPRINWVGCATGSQLEVPDPVCVKFLR